MLEPMPGDHTQQRPIQPELSDAEVTKVHDDGGKCDAGGSVALSMGP